MSIDMFSIESTLARLSLSSAEIFVYMKLLESPRQQISDLVDSSPYHRPRLMELLSSLEERGLVTHKLHGKRKVYKAAPPFVLVDQAKKLLSDTQAIVPELMRKQKKMKVDDIVTYYGESGLSACFLDVVISLKKGDTFYRFSSASDQQFVDSLVPEEYRPIRDAKRLERRVITSKYVGNHKKARLERSVRHFNEDDYPFEHNVVQFIYGDKISLLDFNILTGTIIKNQAIANFQKNIFLALYKRLDRE